MGNVILGLLLLGPNTIYGLNRAFEAGVSLFYRASLGGLSSALAKLLAAGLVTVEAGVDRGRAKKTYTITEAGEAAFHEWMRAPVTESDLETAALARLFFLGHVESAADRAGILRGLVERAEADAAALDAVAEQAGEQAVPDGLEAVARYRLATLRYGQRTHATALGEFRELLAEAETEAAATEDGGEAEAGTGAGVPAGPAASTPEA